MWARSRSIGLPSILAAGRTTLPNSVAARLRELLHGPHGVGGVAEVVGCAQRTLADGDLARPPRREHEVAFEQVGRREIDRRTVHLRRHGTEDELGATARRVIE